MTIADDTAGFEHRFVDTNGIRLHCCVGGPESGPLVLLLHGFPECWVTWRRQLRPLADAGLRVVAPDLRGYGSSDKPARVDAYRASVLVDDLVGLIHAFGKERAHVVGHDWGGVAAWHFAARRSELLDRLVIVNAPHPTKFLKRLRSLDQLRRMYYAFLFQLPLLPERAIARDDFAPLKNIFKFQPRRPGAYDAEDIEAIVAGFRQPGAVAGALAYYRAMGRAVLGRRGAPATSGTLKKTIERPTLILWGMNDAVLPPECIDDVESVCADLRVVRIPDCSHWVTHDAPEVVTRELLAFLR